MNKELLFDSFSQLDENLLARSESAKTHIPWHRWAALAACFVLVAALAVPAITGHLPRAEQAAPPFPDAAEHNEATQVPANSPNAMLPNNGINIPADGTQEDARYAESKQMISYYDIGNMDACYAAPKNGESNFSMPLRAAMEAYGDSVRYRVAVDLFRDERPLPPDGADAKNETARLAALGYITAFETYTDSESSQTWFTLHATYNQLTDFAAAEEYGYMFQDMSLSPLLMDVPIPIPET